MKIRDAIESILQRIRPAIEKDGSRIECVSVEDGIAVLKITGVSDETREAIEGLQRGLERSIQAQLPEIKAVKTLIE